MMKSRVKPAPTVGLIILFAFMLAGCATSRQQGLKPSTDWSRSIELSGQVVGTVGLSVEPQGEHVHLVWPEKIAEGLAVRYMQVDAAVEPVVSELLALPEPRVRTPRLAPASGDQLHLFWGSRSASGSDWALWHGLLNTTNGQVSGIQRLSQEGINLDDYSLAPDEQGGVLAVWSDDGPDGLGAAYLSASGELVSGPASVTSSGVQPSVRFDASGSAYLVWLDGNRILYARLAPEALQPVEGTEVASIRTTTGISLNGPVLGLSDGQAYILWSLLFQAGTESGTATTEFVTFPVAEPQKIVPQDVTTLEDETPELEPFNSFFQINQLAPPVPNPATSPYVYQPATLHSDQPELAVAFVSSQAMRRDAVDQVMLGIFSGGRYLGYLPAGKTPGISADPVIGSDVNGNLYMIWRDGFGGGAIYYATTRADTLALLDAVKPADFINAALSGGLEGFASMLCFPIAGIGWMMPGLLLLGVWKLFREHEDLTSISSWFMLALAVIVYQWLKVLTLPDIITYVPFSAWLQIPLAWEMWLRILTPLLILIAGIAVAEFFRWRSSQSTLRYYVTIVLIDGLLTLAIYGVTFLGVA